MDELLRQAHVEYTSAGKDNNRTPVEPNCFQFRLVCINFGRVNA